jgi:hypothetical protein
MSSFLETVESRVDLELKIVKLQNQVQEAQNLLTVARSQVELGKDGSAVEYLVRAQEALGIDF